MTQENQSVEENVVEQATSEVTTEEQDTSVQSEVSTPSTDKVEQSESIAEVEVKQPAYAAPKVEDLGIQTKKDFKPVVNTIKPTPATVTDQVKVDNSDLGTVQRMVDKEGSKAQKSLVANLERYMEKMKPGMPVNNDEGARNQYQLWRTIQSVIENSSPEEFNKLWYIVLVYFKNFRTGALGERYVFRFSEYWIQSEEDLATFQRILNLIILTADPSTREKNLKQVSLPRTLEKGLTDFGRQRLLSFYNK